MSRASDVMAGVSLIAAVWVGILTSVTRDLPDTWVGVVRLVLAIVTCCYVTGPIYREYLR